MLKRNIKKAGKRKPKTHAKASKTAPTKIKGEICDRYNGIDMCYRCLDLARSLLLCNELNDDELKKIKKIMTDIVKRKGVLKEDVVFLGNLSDSYLS